jgi:hypothetical protein
MERLANPTLRTIGVMFVIAAALLLISAWTINFPDPETSSYAFPSLLIGMAVLFIALVQLALWALNRAHGPTAPPA